MIVIVWTVSGQHYATGTRQVIEVIPTVSTREMDHAMTWVRGLLNHRGRLIPLLDAAVLLGRGACQIRMGSRILVLRVDDGQKNLGSIALQVEQVLGVENLDFENPAAHPGLEIREAEFLGPLVHTDAGIVQLVDPLKILDTEQKAVLFDRIRAYSS